MVALYTVWYNFVKQHRTLKGSSPAMAAGISKTRCSVEGIAKACRGGRARSEKRGLYKPCAVAISN